MNDKEIEKESERTGKTEDEIMRERERKKEIWKDRKGSSE